MGTLRKLGTLPVVVTVLTGILGLYYLLVAFGNVTDWGTNWPFVDHVLQMDDGLADGDTTWRAIKNDGLAKTAYVGIIIWETLTAAVLIWAAVEWIRALLGNRTYGTPRRLTTLGALMGIVLFLLGFYVIGGEWFQMWGNKTFNGNATAMRNVVAAGLTLILAQMVRPRHIGGGDDLDGVTGNHFDDEAHARAVRARDSV